MSSNSTSMRALTLDGVVTAVPRNVRTNEDLGADAIRAAALTGVQQRRHAPADMRIEGLLMAAARRLLINLGWEASSIDALVVVTQTPSIEMPSGAHLIHHGLGLNAGCPAIQVNWACAGYVFGLWLASRIGAASYRVLVLAGDTISQRCDPTDKATWPIFGDAGSATALSIGGDQCATFVIGNGGPGYDALQMRDGRPMTMRGTDVFNFTLREVPGLVADLVNSWSVPIVPDLYLFHQANRFMVYHIVKRAGIEPARVPMNVATRGNTSSASIPLLMCDVGLQALRGKTLAMVGFGAGWAWGGCMLRAHDIRCAEVIEL